MFLRVFTRVKIGGAMGGYYDTPHRGRGTGDKPTVVFQKPSEIKGCKGKKS